MRARHRRHGPTGAILSFAPQVQASADGPARRVAAPPSPGAKRLGAGTLDVKTPGTGTLGMKTLGTGTLGMMTLGAGSLLEHAQAAVPGARATAITLSSKPDAAAMVAFGRERRLFLDPYTGKVLGPGADGVRHFFDTVTGIHRWLGASDANRSSARAVTGACNAAFLLLAFSGPFLWWPRHCRREKIRSVALFQAGPRGRARDYNWHSVLGLWSSAVLIAITGTGVVMSYRWANDLVYRLTGSEPPPAEGGACRGPGKLPTLPSLSALSTLSASPALAAPQRPREGRQGREGNTTGDRRARAGAARTSLAASLDPLWERAVRQAPRWKAITLRVAGRSEPVVFSIEGAASANPFARSTLTLAADGQVISWSPYASASLGRRTRSWIRGTHTGEALGVTGQFLAGAASLAALLLIATVFALATRRFARWIRTVRSIRDGAFDLPSSPEERVAARPRS